MSFVSLDDLAERPHGPAAALPVIRHQREPALDLRRRLQILNEPPFLGGKGLSWRRGVHVFGSINQVMPEARLI